MLNVAVIGVGNMGQHHVRNYFEMPEVDLIAICDIDKKKCENLAKKYACLAYSDYKKMLREQKIDAVSIAVPTSLHYRVTKEVLDMGVHVLLEKPIATDLSKAKKIIDKAKEKSLKLMIGHIERFNPVVQKMKELITEGRLGSIISINIKRVGGPPPQIKGTSVVIDLGTHDIDISNYLLGKYPKNIYGFKSKNLIGRYEDSAVIILEYPKTLSLIEVNWVTPVKIRTMDITGTKGFARLDYINQIITLYENTLLDKNGQPSNFKEFVSKFSYADEIKITMNKEEPLRRELVEFIDAISNNREPLVTGEEAYKVLEIALKI